MGAALAAAAAPFPTKQPAIRCPVNHNEDKYDKGYDSDGEMPCIHDYENDDPSKYDEAAIPSGAPPPAAAAAALAVPTPVFILGTDIMGLKVELLKTELKQRGLGLAGRKADLQARLRENIHLPVNIGAGGVAPRDASMNGLPMSARWELLMPNPVPVTEPTNADVSIRPLTKRDAPVTKKFGYDELFDRIPFTGTNEKIMYTNNSDRMRKRGTSLLPNMHSRAGARVEVKPRVMGGPNKDFLKKYGLNEKSHPMDWLNAILPLTQKGNLEEIQDIDVKGDGISKFSVSNWTSYTNAKAMLSRAGEKGHIYKDKWKDFNDDDIRKFLGTLVIDGLAPLPRLATKMQPQSKGRTQGNNFIAGRIGPNAELKYKLFRHFFGCQDLLSIPPEKAKCPNYKVDEFFS